MKVHIKAKYCDEEVELVFGKYGDGSVAIQGTSLIGEPIFTATVALDEKPAEGCVFLKDWSENQGISEALVKAGIVEMTGRKVPAGFCEALEAKLLVNETVIEGNNMTDELKKRIIKSLSWMIEDMKHRYDDCRGNLDNGSEGEYSPELTEAINLLAEIKEL